MGTSSVTGTGHGGNGDFAYFGISIDGATPAGNAIVRLGNPSNSTLQGMNVGIKALFSLTAGNVLTFVANRTAWATAVTYYRGLSLTVKRIV